MRRAVKTACDGADFFAAYDPELRVLEAEYREAWPSRRAPRPGLQAVVRFNSSIKSRTPTPELFWFYCFKVCLKIELLCSLQRAWENYHIDGSDIVLLRCNLNMPSTADWSAAGRRGGGGVEGSGSLYSWWSAVLRRNSELVQTHTMLKTNTAITADFCFSWDLTSAQRKMSLHVSCSFPAITSAFNLFMYKYLIYC